MDFAIAQSYCFHQLLDFPCATMVDKAEIARLRLGERPLSQSSAERASVPKKIFILGILEYKYKSVRSKSKHQKVPNLLAQSFSPFLILQDPRRGMDKASVDNIKDLDLTPEGSQQSTKPTSNIKNRLKAIWKKWEPLMPAKEHLFDEYNFPQGRYAGQDDENTARN